MEAIASVRVPCPNCGGISEVCFRPATGEVLESTPLEVGYFAPQPSLN